MASSEPEVKKETRGRKPKPRNTEATDRIVEGLRSMFPDHQSFADAGGVRFLHNQLGKCIELVGSPNRLAALLLIPLSDESETGLKVMNRIRSSRHLGSYLLGAIKKDWLPLYGDELPIEGTQDEDTPATHPMRFDDDEDQY